MSAAGEEHEDATGTMRDIQSECVQQVMLELARSSLVAAVRGQPLPFPDPATLPAPLMEQEACFITLRKNGELRGCIGNITARESLYKAIIENTQGAALRDSRFPPVTPKELEVCSIEISVLTTPEDLHFNDAGDLLRKLQPMEHGVVLRIDHRMSTFLPQVWEMIPDKVHFLEHLSKKAGFDARAWRRPDARVQIYRAIKILEARVS